MNLPYYRRNFYVLWLATFLASASYQQVIPFLPLFLQELGVTDSLSFWSGLVFSMHFLSAMVCQPMWGRIADQFGRKPMVVRAGFCLSLLYFLMSMSTAPWHVAALRFLNGALTGFVPGALALVATNTPRELAARYVASLQTANAAGTIIGPAMGGVFADLFGFRGALCASGTTVLICTVMVLLLVNERSTMRVKPTRTLWQDFAMALHHPVLYPVMVTVALTALGTTALQPMLTVYLSELQSEQGRWLSGAVFSLPGVAFVLAASFWTRLGERKRFERLIPVALALAGLVTMMLGWPETIAGFAGVYFAMGLFVAALRPSASALITLRVEESFQGLGHGMQQSAFMLGGLVGPVYAGVVGGLLDTQWAFVAVGLALMAGALWVRHAVRAWEECTVRGSDFGQYRRQQGA